MGMVLGRGKKKDLNLPITIVPNYYKHSLLIKLNLAKDKLLHIIFQ